MTDSQCNSDSYFWKAKKLVGDVSTESADTETKGHSDRVLILGGSGFIGMTTTILLLSEGFEVFLANRGRVHWRREMRQMPGVTHIKADREDYRAFAEALKAATGEKSWMAIVDFSAYKPSHLKAALYGLNSHFEIYIYISTDSVYEVSDRSLWETSLVVTEDCAQRPPEKSRIKAAKKLDSYGHKKLKCEELLQTVSEKIQRRVISLRLADVIGPFDDTDRLWAYWWWCRYSTVSPVFVDKDGASQPLNITFSRDVAAAVLHIIIGRREIRKKGGFLVGPALTEGSGLSAKVRLPAEDISESHEKGYSDYQSTSSRTFEAYNIACQETVTLVELLKRVYESSGGRTDGLAIQISEDSGSTFPIFLPSVCRQKPLGLQHVKDRIGFYPTPLSEALLETCSWFEYALSEYPEEAREAVRKLPEAIRHAAIAETTKRRS